MLKVKSMPSCTKIHEGWIFNTMLFVWLNFNYDGRHSNNLFIFWYTLADVSMYNLFNKIKNKRNFNMEIRIVYFNL